jgi:hypothetical protein
MGINKYQEYSEAQLRDHINELVEQYGEGTSPVEGLMDLAEMLDIKLKPDEVKIDCYVMPVSNKQVGFYNDMWGTTAADITQLLRIEFNRSFNNNEGVPVTLSIKERI